MPLVLIFVLVCVQGIPASRAADEIVTGIPGSGAPLTLAESVEKALGANAGLQAERTRLEELRSQMTQARAIGLPVIDLSGTWSRGRDPSFAFSETFSGDEGAPQFEFGPGETNEAIENAFDQVFAGLSFIPSAEDIAAETYWRTSLNARWELRPGLIYNAVGAAGLGVERQDLVIEDAENRLIEQVMSAYYGVIRADELLAALDADLAAREQFLDVTRRRFFVGFSTALDTLRAAVNLANLVPLRRNAEQGLEDAAARLNILMGRPAMQSLAVIRDQPVEREAIDAELAAKRIALRPDIRQIELLSSILRKNRGAQKAEHRPYLSADASYGYVTRELGELTDPGHDFWSANLSLNIPIFDGLLTRGRVKETEASIRRLHHEREEAQRQARLELIALVGELEAARSNLEAAELNMSAAEDALEQITLRYELGKADYLSVLDVQTQRLQARGNQIQARNNVLTLTAALKRAMGYPPMMPLTDVLLALEDH